MAEYPQVHWKEGGKPRSARWRSESGVAPPKRVIPADDHMTADAAYRIACQGTALLWHGDYQNARQLLQAMARRIDRKPQAKPAKKASGTAAPKDAGVAPPSMQEAFNLYRMAKAQRARILGMLLLSFEADYRLLLPRAPEVRLACEQAYGPGSPDDEPFLVSLRELLGLIGAYEWRRRGIDIPEVGGRIHPHYGVFSPVRGEYVALVAEAPLPAAVQQPGGVAFDIGTGTGVLAAVLARRGAAHVIATDQDVRALACARENITRLQLDTQVSVEHVDLFPAGRAALIVCNPPWLPGRPSSPLESAIYDLDSRMLLGFLNGLSAHLAPGGEGWLILSDFAEHLGLRTRAWLLAAIEAAGLRVIDRMNRKPHHLRAADRTDPFYAARSAEVTSLWRLTVA